uniref:Uncharacterized protein n=1 Tax=Romanomermis culicivorax TaxID=13658 RepID=A0A915HRK9_ROMCU
MTRMFVYQIEISYRIFHASNLKYEKRTVPIINKILFKNYFDSYYVIEWCNALQGWKLKD